MLKAFPSPLRVCHSHNFSLLLTLSWPKSLQVLYNPTPPSLIYLSISVPAFLQASCFLSAFKLLYAAVLYGRHVQITVSVQISLYLWCYLSTRSSQLCIRLSSPKISPLSAPNTRVIRITQFSNTLSLCSLLMLVTRYNMYIRQLEKLPLYKF